MMAGHRLEIGEHGDITYRSSAGKVTASFYYRNSQGQRRRIEATADSKAAARRLALASLERTLQSGAAAGFSPRSTFAEVAEQWHRHVAELVAVGQRSPTTVALYRSVLDLHILPAIGGLRLAEVTTARMDHFVHQKRRDRGYAIAKLCRSIVSGVCSFAARRGAMSHNPVRDVGRLEGNVTQARALSLSECQQWLAILDSDTHAVERDLPDLVRFLLGTGVRLGEALGLMWTDVNLDQQIVHVRRTVVRVKGQGLLAKAPKTQAGVRVLRMPAWLTVLLRQRRASANLEGPVFPDSVGGFRDVNNVERAFRRVRTGTPFEWVVPHTYRKTVATLLDGGGLSARSIADQLGHSRVSMTQDVYLGRRVVDDAAATRLNDAFRRPHRDVPPALER